MRKPPAVAVTCALLAVLATTTLPASGDDGPRTGWCHEGEGLTVVLDWTAAVDPTPIIDSPDGNSILVRCIPLSGDGETLPVDVPGNEIASILNSAGIEATGASIVDTINGIQGFGMGGDDPWWVTTDGDATTGLWGSSWMVQPPYIDKAFGVTYFFPESDPELTKPRTNPELLPPVTPSPSQSPTPSTPPSSSAPPNPSASATAPGSPSAAPSGPSTSGPPRPTSEPTSVPTTAGPPPATRTTSPRRTPARASSPSQTQARASSPSQTQARASSPSQAPTPDPATATPPPVSAAPSPQPPTPDPSPVWGQENAARTRAQDQSGAAVPGWSPLATIAALAMLAVGGVGFTVRGLRPPAPAGIEDE